MTDTTTLPSEDLRALLANARTALDEATAQQRTLNLHLQQARTDCREARRELEQFKARVRERIAEARVQHDLCMDSTNEVLTDLGLDPLQTTYEVTVTDEDGVTVLTVSGVEADDEDAACEHVMEHLNVTATITKVHFDLSYDGNGDTDWTDSEPEWKDPDSGEDSAWADTYKDNLNAAAGEE